MAGHRPGSSGQRRELGEMVEHLPNAGSLTFASIFFGTVRILPTQKDAASNLGRFTAHPIAEEAKPHKITITTVDADRDEITT